VTLEQDPLGYDYKAETLAGLQARPEQPQEASEETGQEAVRKLVFGRSRAQAKLDVEGYKRVDRPVP